MTLEKAERIVRAYGHVIAQAGADSVYNQSLLPASKPTIRDAIDVVGAEARWRLSPSLKDELETAVLMLPFFVEQAEATRINSHVSSGVINRSLGWESAAERWHVIVDESRTSHEEFCRRIDLLERSPQPELQTAFNARVSERCSVAPVQPPPLNHTTPVQPPRPRQSRGESLRVPDGAESKAGFQPSSAHSQSTITHLAALAPNVRSAETGKLIEMALVASDGGHRLWSQEEVAAARAWLQQKYQHVLTIDMLTRRLGAGVVEEGCTRVVEARQEELRELATIASLARLEDKCHGCGSRDALTPHPFGLVQIQSERVDWKGTAATVGVGLGAAFLVGVLTGGVVRMYGRPGRIRRGRVLRLNLMLCWTCLDKKKGLFGGVRLGKRDYISHPCWETAVACGYAQFVGEAELKLWTPA